MGKYDGIKTVAAKVTAAGRREERGIKRNGAIVIAGATVVAIAALGVFTALFAGGEVREIAADFAGRAVTAAGRN